MNAFEYRGHEFIKQTSYFPTFVRRVVFRWIIHGSGDETQEDDILILRRYDEINETVDGRREVSAFYKILTPIDLSTNFQADLNLFVRGWRVVVS